MRRQPRVLPSLHAFASCSILIAAFNIILWPVDGESSRKPRQSAGGVASRGLQRRLSEHDLQERQAALLKGAYYR